jgi:hypothetical protein
MTGEFGAGGPVLSNDDVYEGQATNDKGITIMKLTTTTQLSVDGVMQGNGPSRRTAGPDSSVTDGPCGTSTKWWPAAPVGRSCGGQRGLRFGQPPRRRHGFDHHGLPAVVAFEAWPWTS